MNETGQKTEDGRRRTEDGMQNREQRMQNIEQKRNNRPMAVWVFGVLNCILGGLGIMYTPFMMPVRLAAIRHTMKPTTEFGIWSLAAIVVGFGFYIWLLRIGNGLLRFKRVARTRAVLYGWLAILFFIVEIVVNLAAIYFGWITIPRDQTAEFIMGMGIGAIGWLIYPALLLIFMKTRKVKEAFTNEGG